MGGRASKAPPCREVTPGLTGDCELALVRIVVSHQRSALDSPRRFPPSGAFALSAASSPLWIAGNAGNATGSHNKTLAYEALRELWQADARCRGNHGALIQRKPWQCHGGHLVHCHEPPTMPYTLSEAAAACGINRSTVLRALKSGKISGTHDKAGAWHVDAAELHRIFAPVASAQASPPAMPQHAHTDALIRQLEAALSDMRNSEPMPWQTAINGEKLSRISSVLHCLCRGRSRCLTTRTRRGTALVALAAGRLVGQGGRLRSPAARRGIPARGLSLDWNYFPAHVRAIFSRCLRTRSRGNLLLLQRVGRIGSARERHYLLGILAGADGRRVTEARRPLEFEGAAGALAPPIPGDRGGDTFLTEQPSGFHAWQGTAERARLCPRLALGAFILLGGARIAPAGERKS